jgi:LPS export ABC transporter permease LptG/LPS export ABC transporter permease LptF
MSVLVGTLIGLSRMAADGEVIAARASGIGVGQFARPVMAFALAGWGLTLWMSSFLGPQSLRELHRMEAGLKTSQVPYEIQPRVFVEQFPNRLLYLEDVTGSRAQWRGVFLADTIERDAIKITLAETGMLVNEPGSAGLTLHLKEGSTHETDPQHPQQYSVISFTETAIPIPLEETGVAPSEPQTPSSWSLQELVEKLRSPPERQAARVELHYRLALPVASLVLALVGLPLGLYTRKGGKAAGLMLTILLVFAYYILMAFGRSLSMQRYLDPAVGLWIANLVFAIGGVVMMAHLRRVRLHLQFIQDWLVELGRRFEPSPSQKARADAPPARPARPAVSNRLFQILDIYIFQGWVFYFLILLVTFTGVYMVFDFFQLLGDMVRNQVHARVVIDYYRFLLPQVVYLMLPLSILVATLVNFGLLTKTNQITAIKSAGISLYRISLPILFMAALLSLGMFVLDDQYLPKMNQRQDALRNQIKGKPAQTFYRPDRQWIFGEKSRIYNYRFFDPDRNIFANLSVFEFDQKTFRMTRRIYATRAFWEEPMRDWVLENGWMRELQGDRVTAYLPFSVATVQGLTHEATAEEPPYFKKEMKPSAQMSARELSRYIDELSQSGFDVVRLSVQLYGKFAFPLIAFVVALIGVPFSFTTGRKGAVSGIALSIGIAIVYWSVSSLFDAMGNLNQLPPAVAAWSPDVLFGLGGVYLLLRVRT